jgi:hypothetical protein
LKTEKLASHSADPSRTPTAGTVKLGVPHQEPHGTIGTITSKYLFN